MLLVGDIHINARKVGSIMTGIRTYIERFPEEKVIIFVGDFVFHFAYHRKSLLELFSYFVSLYAQGKHVYVLAGNHDRIGESFVYAEGEEIMASLQEDSAHTGGKLCFLTNLQYKKVEDCDGFRDILFVPHILKQDIPVDIDFLTECISNNQRTHSIFVDSLELMQSDNKMEIMSGYINLRMLELYYKKKSTMLTIIHHRYVAKTVYPGQRGTFSYAQGSIHPGWLDIQDVVLISGHIHQCAIIKNFFCIGSLWHTSPSEMNHYKICASIRGNTITPSLIHISPYIQIQLKEGEEIDEACIQQSLSESLRMTKSTMQSNNSWEVAQYEDILPMRSDVHVQLITDIPIDTVHASETTRTMLQKFADYKTYQSKKGLDSLLATLDTAEKNLHISLYDWKKLLIERLEQKHKEQAPLYIKILEDLHLL